MRTAKELSDSFGTTTWIIKKQAEGLSHEQMVIQPPFRGNCFNWVLGHIVTNRDQVLAVLGAEPLFSEEDVARYRTGSRPVTDGEMALPSGRLMAAIDESQKRIVDALAQATPEALAAVYNQERSQSVADRIDGLHWHETYHTGQLELLRQLAGMDDAII